MFRRRRRRVVIYGKPGCHLCDDALAHLRRLKRRYPMDIEEIDITSDPALFRRYDIRIPVIEIDGVERLEAPVDEKALRAALRLRL